MRTLPKLLGLVGSDWALLLALLPMALLALVDIGLISIALTVSRRLGHTAAQLAELTRIVRALRSRSDDSTKGMR